MVKRRINILPASNKSTVDKGVHPVVSGRLLAPTDNNDNKYYRQQNTYETLFPGSLRIYGVYITGGFRKTIRHVSTQEKRRIDEQTISSPDLPDMKGGSRYVSGTFLISRDVPFFANTLLQQLYPPCSHRLGDPPLIKITIR